MINPYTVNPVSDPSYYELKRRGRGRLAHRLVAALRQQTPPPSHVSLVGERRTGKTSLLRFLERELAGEDDRLQVATVDMLSLIPSDPTGFYGMLTRSLRKAEVLEEDATLADVIALYDLIDRLEAEQRRLVLLIDELDVVARHRNFNVEFFETLRHAAGRDELVLVAASVTRLSEIAADDIWGSPFFNIFLPAYVGLLSEQEAEALIARGFDDPTIKEQVLATAGRHPYLLQLACDHAWWLREEADRPIDADTLREALEGRVHEHFSYVWEHAPPAERDALMALARGEAPKAAPRNRLRQRGYVDGDRLFCPAFEDFLLELASEEDPGDPAQARLPSLIRPLMTDASQPRTDVALVIGVNRYRHEESGPYRLATLRYAERDADELSALLEHELGFEVTKLVGEEATATAVKQAFNEFERATRGTTHPDSTFVFHFSGHGQLDPDHDERAHLVLHTTDPARPGDEGIQMDRLVDALLPRVHLPRTLVLLDACHAGYAAGVKDVMPARVANIAQQLLTHATGRLVLAACSGDEQAREEDDLEHGVFTYYLLEHWRDLKGEHPPDRITFGSLVEYVGGFMRDHPRVPEPVWNTTGQGPFAVLRALAGSSNGE